MNFSIIADCSDKIYMRFMKDKQSLIFLFCSEKLPHSDEIFINNKIKDLSQIETFYQIYQLLSENNLPIPKIYFENDNSLLLQDLGDINLACYLESNSKKVIEFYQNILDNLAKIQKIPYENTIIESRKLDYDALYAELNQYFINYFEIKDQSIISEISKLCREISSYKLVPTHRDFQPRNIFIYDEKPYIIDFQDMCLGPYTYDIASLLFSQNYILSNKERELLLHYYWKNYIKHPGDKGKFLLYKFNEFVSRCYLTAVHRCLKSFSRHYYFHKEKERDPICYQKSLKCLKDTINFLSSSVYPNLKLYIQNL